MELIYVMVGVIVGFLGGWLMTRGKHGVAVALLEAERQKRQEDKEQDALLLQSIKQESAKALQQVKDETREQRQRDLEDLRRSYEEQMLLLRQQMTAATEQMIHTRSQQLQQANTQQMDALFRPIRDNIRQMEQSMNDNREAHIRSTTSFETAMRQMMERTSQIGQQADRLSNALTHKNKTMGNWGELILTDLLDSQGLRRGFEYDAQQTLRDADGQTLLNEDTGQRMVPDVVLHLADNRDVIIDAKMSLTAFVDYVNASSDVEREEALRRHIESIRGHIKELSMKDYSNYIVKPRVSSDFVIMFVPNDGAVHLLMQTAPELWHEAFNKHKVFIVSSQTLIAALHIIDLTWRNYRQERNTQKIMEEARKLVERTEQFYQKFSAVGRKLEEAQKAYLEVNDKVKDGRLSILGAGRTLEQLGVRGKKPLPQPEEEL